MTTYDRLSMATVRTTGHNPPIAVLDLDSMICDTRHRRHLAPRGWGKSNQLSAWEPYSLACGNDTVILGGATLARLLHGQNRVFLLSARCDVAEQVTLEWLAANGVPFDRLRLRGSHETTPDSPTAWKVSVVDQWLKEGWNIQLFVDDWADTCTAVEFQLGIPSIAPTYLAGDHKPGF